MKTKMPQRLSANVIFLLGSILNACAGWTPPQGSVAPPTVVTPDMLPAGFASPMGHLVLGPDGALYGGTTLGGGPGDNPGSPNDNGTLFKLQPDGSVTQLHVFHWSDGSYWSSDLISPNVNVAPLQVGPDGALYGCTQMGGALGLGTLFKLETNGAFTVLHDFMGSDGGGPNAGLVLGPDGALYGTTVSPGGVFRLALDGSVTQLHAFIGDSGPDGNLLFENGDGYEFRDSALVVGPDGALYGATPFGGSIGGDGGVIFKQQINGIYTILHDFTTSFHDGFGSKSALVVGSDGFLYGTTEAGGTFTYGTLYKVDTNGVYTLLHSFSGQDGAFPKSLVKGADGALYGVASYALFKVDTNGNFSVLYDLNSSDGANIIGPMVVGPDGALYGSASEGGALSEGTLFSLETNGIFTKLYDFGYGFGGPIAQPGALVLGPDLGIYGSAQAGGTGGGTVFKLVLPFTRPLLESLSPSQATSGSGDVSVTVNGVGFASGARVFFDSVEVAVTYVGTTNLQAVVPASALPSPIDFATMQVTVLNPGGGVSKPVAFTVLSPAVSGTVSQVQSGVAAAGDTATVQAPPNDPTTAGVTASLQNTVGTTPATVTVASYTQNPTPSPAFNAGGGFVDLQVSGVSPTAQLSSSFYYPQTISGAAEAALTLQFFNGTQWITVLSSGGVPPNKNTTDNLDGTISGGRFQVVFDSTSTPPITALNGTVFAVAVPDTTPPQIACPNVTVSCALDLTVPVAYPAPTVSDNVDPAPKVTYSVPNGSGFPVGTTTVTATATDAAGNSSHTTFTVTRAALQFSGFLSPVGGADSTGGSYSAPLRTFKAGSTIPVKFTAQCGGSPVVTGVHRLQAVKYTSATTAGTPIDATPQDAATTGDQFLLTSSQWQFNLDTRSTGMTTGIWLLLATLSDGSQHSVWVQIK